MNKTTLKILFIMFFAATYIGTAQTLNQNAMWPNASWTLTGTYNADPLALEADPTVDANFAFDDDDAGNGNDDEIAAESPVIDLTAAHGAGETWITVSGNFVYNYNNDDILQFEYWDADASTWNIIGTPVNADTSTPPTDNFCGGTTEAYTTDVLNIVGFTATQLSGFRYRIYFDDTVGGAGWEWGFCFDAPTITSVAPPSCPDPSLLVVTSTTDTTADLAWTESGSATAWDIEIVTTGTPPTGTATNTGVTNPYTAMGLTAATEYDYYVRADCAVDGSSAWVGPFTFTTACSVFTPDYEADMSTNVPNCWEEADNGDAASGPMDLGAGLWFASNHNGTPSNVINMWQANRSDWIISPEFDLSAAAPSELKVYVALTENITNGPGADLGSDDMVSLLMTTDGGATWSSLQSWEQGNVPTDVGEEIAYDLSAVTGNVQFAFLGDEGAVDDIEDVYFHVSKFQVREIPSCEEPAALTATNIMATSANLGWTAGGSETLWDIEIVDITAGEVASGNPSEVGVENPHNATGLTDNNSYEFYVRADCVDNGTSAWAGPFAFTTACSAIEAPYIEDFETFTTGGAAFGAENCWSGTGGAYYWESAPGTDAGSGGTGPDPTITTGNYFYTEASGGADGDTTDLLSPLVDLSALTAPALTFNYHMFGAQIGTLDIIVNGTTNVWTLSGQQQASATAPWELAVVDLSAYAGQTISVTFRGTSVGTFEGDISIDNVSFTELPACSQPSALGATMITDTTADLAWTENGTAMAWDIEIVDITAAGMPTGTPTTSGVTNPYTVMGLTQNNDFTFYVRSDCGGGTLSDWSGPFAFSTVETCPAPSGLTATNILETTADLGWTENGAATSWNIELVDLTAGGTATGTATASGVMNPYAATGLVADNNYEFYVQSDCGVDGVSAWTGPFAFATPYVAVPPTCTSGSFLDSGGQSGDYSDGENITYTICPDMAGDAVTVEFTFFSVENNGATGCWDGLTIHDGADATATTIDPPGGGTTWCWDEDDTPAVGTGDLEGMMITSSDASGCLTFVFTSDSSAVRDGWEGNITCGPLSVESFENRGFFHYVDTVNNSFNVNAQSNISSIEVYNLIGQIITTAKPNAASGAAYLGSAKNGVYFARVTLENGRSSIVKFAK